MEFEVDGRAMREYPTVAIIIYVFYSITFYNVIELWVFTFATFKRFRGLYCWSFITSNTGIAFNSLGCFLRSLPNAPPFLAWAPVVLLGWLTMTTGQSLVLYSRLHIVLHSHKLLKFVRLMIIINAIWLGVPLIVLLYLSYAIRSPELIDAYTIFENVQVTTFFTQECIISGLYVSETVKILRSHRGLNTGSSRKIMAHLILVNLVMIIFDITVLYLQYAAHYDALAAWKPLVYSVRLKMEFSVLNRLVELSERVRRSRGLNFMDTTFVDEAGLPLDLVDEGIIASNSHPNSVVRRSLNDNEAVILSRGQSSAGNKSKNSGVEDAVRGVEA